MYRRTVVTLISLILIAATPATTRYPHSVAITTFRIWRFDTAHVLLGVAVLGHHVGRLESGWLVKQAGAGILHIDWSRGGKWNGLTRTEEGPRDVSQGQLDAVIRTIEQLGYPSSAIRAWRVAAPVGYDGFHEGDKVLTIGEILVDLGTPDQARPALEHWWNRIIGDNDPFDKIPLTNVRYADGLYIQPDCDDAKRTFRDESLAEAAPLAALVGAAAKSRVSFVDYSTNAPYRVVCPGDRPNFMSADGGPPISLRDFDLSASQDATVTYALSSMPQTAEATVPPDELSKPEQAYSFALTEPYAGTIGQGDSVLTADAAVLHFTYEMGTKARPAYGADLASAQERIDALRHLVRDSQQIVERRAPSDAANDRIDLYIRLQPSEFATIGALAKAWKRTGIRFDSAGMTEFISGCGAAEQKALKGGLAKSRRKAEALAKMMHTAVRELAAVRTGTGVPESAICGAWSNVSLEKMVSLVTYLGSGGVTEADARSVHIAPMVDAAWTLTRAPKSATPPVRAEYRSHVEGDMPIDALQWRAFMQAARQAIVDDPKIVSIFETPASIETYNPHAPSVDQALIVIR